MKSYTKAFIIISQILTLLGFLSSHFLIGLHFNSFDKPLWFWILSDIYLYLSIILELIIISVIIGVD